MLDLKGVIPPMVTPFNDGGDIDYAAFEHNIEKYLESGIQGYLVLGSNGESVYLEQSEKLKLIDLARKRVPSSKMLLAGTGLESTGATIELTKQAADLGVDAVLVKNPFYFKRQMTFDVYLAHYRAVADASPIPVIIYNVPGFTGISVESRLIIELAKHNNIIGLKESSGDVKLISEVAWDTSSDTFSILAGTAATLLPSMTAGAKGGIVAIACACPKALLLLYRSLSEGDYKRAGFIQGIVGPPAEAVTTKYGVAGLKAIMNLEGFKAGIPRRPLLPLATPQRDDLQQIFRRMHSQLAEIS